MRIACEISETCENPRGKDATVGRRGSTAAKTSRAHTPTTRRAATPSTTTTTKSRGSTPLPTRPRSRSRGGTPTPQRPTRSSAAKGRSPSINTQTTSISVSARRPSLNSSRASNVGAEQRRAGRKTPNHPQAELNNRQSTNTRRTTTPTRGRPTKNNRGVRQQSPPIVQGSEAGETRCVAESGNSWQHQQAALYSVPSHTPTAMVSLAEDLWGPTARRNVPPGPLSQSHVQQLRVAGEPALLNIDGDFVEVVEAPDECVEVDVGSSSQGDDPHQLHQGHPAQEEATPCEGTRAYSSRTNTVFRKNRTPAPCNGDPLHTNTLIMLQHEEEMRKQTEEAPPSPASSISSFAEKKGYSMTHYERRVKRHQHEITSEDGSLISSATTVTEQSLQTIESHDSSFEKVTSAAMLRHPDAVLAPARIQRPQMSTATSAINSVRANKNTDREKMDGSLTRSSSGNSAKPVCIARDDSTLTRASATENGVNVYSAGQPAQPRPSQVLLHSTCSPALQSIVEMYCDSPTPDDDATTTDTCGTDDMMMNPVLPPRTPQPQQQQNPTNASQLQIFSPAEIQPSNAYHNILMGEDHTLVNHDAAGHWPVAVPMSQRETKPPAPHQAQPQPQPQHSSPQDSQLLSWDQMLVPRNVARQLNGRDENDDDDCISIDVEDDATPAPTVIHNQTPPPNPTTTSWPSKPSGNETEHAHEDAFAPGPKNSLSRSGSGANGKPYFSAFAPPGGQKQNPTTFDMRQSPSPALGSTMAETPPPLIQEVSERLVQLATISQLATRSTPDISTQMQANQMQIAEIEALQRGLQNAKEELINNTIYYQQQFTERFFTGPLTEG